MNELTPLDAFHAAMQASPENDNARLRFYERMGDSELYLMLTEEARGQNLSPEVFEVADGRFVLAFDGAERLAQFAGCPAPYAALSGRALVQMLAGTDIGIGLNLEVAPSSILIPCEAISWLAETLDNVPKQVMSGIREVAAPAALPDALLSALGDKLALVAGLARNAYLCQVTHADGTRGHLLGFVDAPEPGQRALAQAVAEALTFSGIEAGALDVGFFAAEDAILPALTQNGLRFDLPQPRKPAATPVRAAPGSDPDRPPILR
ncbi:SseB family protein [Rhodobacteraceae bacterium F11138]|nr:SseB family protein [Rhodobacteraceae bacterium F11138]